MQCNIRLVCTGGLDSVEYYDIASNEWRAVTPMPWRGLTVKCAAVGRHHLRPGGVPRGGAARPRPGVPHRGRQVRFASGQLEVVHLQLGYQES